YGVNIYAPNNIVGGTTASARNIISGNASAGLYVSSFSGNVVQGNYIGTDVTGTRAVDNGYQGSGDGVVVDGATATVVGGTAAGAGNVLSGTHRYGLYLGLTSYSTVQGNYIGTDFSGANGLGNGLDGIFLSGTDNNLIGGTMSGARNVISANNGYGIDSAGSY